jgi:hypothetical protein
MKLLFSNNKTIDLSLDGTPLGTVYQKIYKNLSQANFTFNEWDNPYYVHSITYQELVDRLTYYAQKVSIQVDQESCLLHDQTYFNNIHKIYEKNYNGTRAWLDFHEHIHMCEHYFEENPKFLHIDYREKSGLLEKPFDLKWLDTATNNIKAGDIFVSWAELGKTPYSYWQNKEADDIVRMCELVKPWLMLRPKINIALEDIDLLRNRKILEFESWWQQYSKVWCQHWNIPSWTIYNIFSSTVFGKVHNVSTIIDYLKNNIIPTKILMS